MTDSESRRTPKPPLNPDKPAGVEPSWKPLLWFGGGLILLIALWEVFLELGVNLFELLFKVIENVWLVLIEAPEEFLEDQLTGWLKNHFPHDADRYAEITTAIGLTPLKLLLIVFLLRWLWRHSHSKLIPRTKNWLLIRVTQVKLAWRQLAWPYRILGGVVLAGILFILI